jgi:hypothetical protein
VGRHGGNGLIAGEERRAGLLGGPGDQDIEPGEDPALLGIRGSRQLHDHLLRGVEEGLEEAELVWAMLDHAAKHQAREPLPETGIVDSAESFAVPSVTDDSESMPGVARHDSAASGAGTTTTAGAPSGAGCGPDDSAASCIVAGVTEPGTRTAMAPVRRPSVLQLAADARKQAFNRADALLVVAQSYLRGDRPNRTPVDVMVTIPLSNLREGAADAAEVLDAGLIGDSCVSAETSRRLSCDAGVIEVVEDEHGVPLSVGRKRRTISGSIKRALLRRDKTCSFPGAPIRYSWRLTMSDTGPTAEKRVY